MELTKRLKSFAHAGSAPINDACAQAIDEIERLYATVECYSREQKIVHAANRNILKAAIAVRDDACSMLCPSHWETEKGRPPHHPKCVALRKAIYESRYADLRASGGLVEAP